MAKTSGLINYTDLDIKRFYLPGMILEETCPHCSYQNQISLSDHYPYGFESDGSCQLSFLCQSCEEAIDLSMKLEITLKSK